MREKNAKAKASHLAFIEVFLQFRVNSFENEKRADIIACLLT